MMTVNGRSRPDSRNVTLVVSSQTLRAALDALDQLVGDQNQPAGLRELYSHAAVELRGGEQ